MTDPRRHLPGVDALLDSPEFKRLLEGHPRRRVVDAVRETLDAVRLEVGGGEGGSVPVDEGDWAARVEELLLVRGLPSLRGVINATGVVLHTNLGRAPLSEATRAAMTAAGVGYSNLEFDLDAGERGSRYAHCVDLLKELTGAPDALVVNNNAAAVTLALNTLAAGREVLVSRGELVEIGGGFRIPEMLSRSGAVLREVGTTNRTRIEDYRKAAEAGQVSAILKVHRSNFRISGFTEEAGLPELGALAGELGLFFFHDLGSGLLAEPDLLGLPPEPRAPDSLKSGAHAVAISGDKLLGGPQAGIILGNEDVVEAMRKNPLCRALRVDKVTLAGLGATLRHYLDPEEALREIPTLRMLVAPLGGLEDRARRLSVALTSEDMEARVAPGMGVVGGGTLPGVELPSRTLRVKVPDQSPHELARRLRAHDPPVVARVENDDVVLDLRTVDPADDSMLLTALREESQEGSEDSKEDAPAEPPPPPVQPLALREESQEGSEDSKEDAPAEPPPLSIQPLLRPAIFLDRDGTIIEEGDYLADPASVRLIPGAVEGLTLLSEAGFTLVVVTNQSGIARGFFSLDDYEAVAERVEELLSQHGLELDATHFCPHHPDITGECNCRKPATGMHRAAVDEMDLDPTQSFFVGDRLRDLLPALELGGEGILVRTGHGSKEEDNLPDGFRIADDLHEAAKMILS